MSKPGLYQKYRKQITIIACFALLFCAVYKWWEFAAEPKGMTMIGAGVFSMMLLFNIDDLITIIKKEKNKKQMPQITETSVTERL